MAEPFQRAKHFRRVHIRKFKGIGDGNTKYLMGVGVQHHAAAFYEQLEYYTLTSSTGEKYDAELYCFGNNATLHLSLHEGPVSEISYNRLSPLKYVFSRAID